MLLLCLKKYDATHDIVITFANTGCEHHKTLDFVHKCDQLIGGRVVWLEAIVSPEDGVGIRHEIVNYETASRNGEPFESAIKKYGIFNQTTPACTSRLKAEVMEHYLKQVDGWQRGVNINYDTAIGIRADELDRVPTKEVRERNRFVYPLVDEGVTRTQVLDFWSKQPFDLELPDDHYGNCVWCWKKTDRKLYTLAIEQPDVFDFPEKMEKLYGTHKADRASGHNGRRYFFRKHRSVADIKREAHAKNFRPYRSAYQMSIWDGDWDSDLDIGGSCGDSCEIY